MRQWVISLAYRARRVFHRLGVTPPVWMVRWGRRLVHPPPAPPVAPGEPHAQALRLIHERLDHLAWHLDRVDAMAYLRSIDPDSGRHFHDHHVQQVHHVSRGQHPDERR